MNNNNILLSMSIEKPCVIYVRVSTALQTTQGDKYGNNHVSLDNQLDACKKYAEEKGYTIKGIYQEVGSATTMKGRDKLKDALLSMRKGDTLVFYALTRLSRSNRDFINIYTKLLEEGKHLQSVKEQLDFTSATGKAMVSMLSLMAQLESDNTSERVKDAMRFNKVVNHRFQGRPPYGYEIVDGYLSRIEDELEIVKTILDYRSRGITYKKITEILNEENIKRKDKDWTYHAVRNIDVAKDKYMPTEYGTGTDKECYEIYYVKQT